MKFLSHRNQHAVKATRLERRDTEVEDPFTLHWETGLMSYWVKLNTWSIDGLPGLKQVMPRVTPADVKQAMAEFGLKPSAPASKGRLAHELTIMLFGLILGMLLMSVVQRRSQTTASLLRVGDACVYVYSRNSYRLCSEVS